MTRSLGIWTAAAAFILSSGFAAYAGPQKSAAKGKAVMVTCPIMHDKVLKSKAIPVKTRSGKTVYVCCKDCVAAAKKLK